ncbi:MAG: macro domain-containing protein [Candidatus Methylomirabilales bacterium]
MAGTLVKRIDYPDGRRFEVVIYDLLDEPTDAIVNAANGGLSHGGGVAAAISKAAGPALDDEGNRIVRERGRIPVGDAVVTTAGKLRFKGVIHAVGPRMGDGNEGEKIVQALKAALLRAHERSWSSVSFPAISSGIYSVPHEICARAYLRAVREFFQEYPDSSVRWIRLVLFQGPLLEAVKTGLEAEIPHRFRNW